jgi:hypothetical protein
MVRPYKRGYADRIWHQLRGELAKQLCQFSDQRAVINVRAALQSNQRAQHAKQLCQFNDQRAVINVRAALQSNQRAQHAKQLCQFVFRDRVPMALTQDIASSSRHLVSLGIVTQ